LMRNSAMTTTIRKRTTRTASVRMMPSRQPLRQCGPMPLSWPPARHSKPRSAYELHMYRMPSSLEWPRYTCHKARAQTVVSGGPSFNARETCAAEVPGFLPHISRGGTQI
jgi:hypothetical protein